MIRRLLVLLLVLAVLLGVGVRLAATRPGPLPRDADLVIPHGGAAAVAGILQRDGVLRGGRPARLLFVALSRFAGHGALHAAELRFPAHASLLDALFVLRHARPVQHELTIPEGLTAAQVAMLVDRAPALSGSLDLPAEGALLPETYSFERGTSRTALAGRMRQAMRDAVLAAWNNRDRSIPLADPAELLVLASIVERETGVPAERSMVAEVFLNRLRARMRLQSDPTVSYAVAGGLGSLPRPLTRADLAWPTPTNTYLVPALPPYPICSPGRASLDAVAHPAQGVLLYFVANGTGGHAFADTLPGHLRNVAQFRALEAAHPDRTPTLDPLRPPPQVPAAPRR